MQENIKYLFNEIMRLWRLGCIDWDKRNEMLDQVNQIANSCEKVIKICDNSYALHGAEITKIIKELY